MIDFKFFWSYFKRFERAEVKEETSILKRYSRIKFNSCAIFYRACAKIPETTRQNPLLVKKVKNGRKHVKLYSFLDHFRSISGQIFIEIFSKSFYFAKNNFIEF